MAPVRGGALHTAPLTQRLGRERLPFFFFSDAGLNKRAVLASAQNVGLATTACRLPFLPRIFCPPAGSFEMHAVFFYFYFMFLPATAPRF